MDEVCTVCIVISITAGGLALLNNGSDSLPMSDNTAHSWNYMGWLDISPLGPLS